MTQLAGLSTYREGVNLAAHRSIEQLVLPAEIQMLEPFCGYLCIAGKDRTTIRIPKLYLTPRYPAFMPRPGAMRLKSAEPSLVPAITEADAEAVNATINEPSDQEILGQLAGRR